MLTVVSVSVPRYRLISVCFSHYVERARWALERFGVDYEEEPHMPFFHMPFVWRVHRGRAGRRDAASSRLSTPVLLTPAGDLVCDSRKILDYLDLEHAPADARLYPREHPEAARLDALEQRWHDKLATHSRRLAYGACFSAPGALSQIAAHNVSKAEARVFRMCTPLVRPAMTRYLSIDDDALERSRAVCFAELDAAAELLADGRPYLGGEHFSGWDLSFACFASPIILPPEYGAWLPDRSEFDAETVAYLDEVAQHPAAAHAQRMFAEHRRAPAS